MVVNLEPEHEGGDEKDPDEADTVGAITSGQSTSQLKETTRFTLTFLEKTQFAG